MGKREISDFNGIRKGLMELADLIIPKEKKVDGEVYCDHPFAESIKRKAPNGRVLDLSKERNYKIWKKDFKNMLENSMFLGAKLMLAKVNPPYHLAALKYCGQYMSDYDYASWLLNSWTMLENPNGDPIVSREELVEAFKEADKDFLMYDFEREHFDNLPEKVTLYRGVAEGRAYLGLSWTDNREKAEWFKNRFGKNGKLLKVVVDKKHILAYINRRLEEECVLDVFAVREDIVVEI